MKARVLVVAVGVLAATAACDSVVKGSAEKQLGMPDSQTQAPRCSSGLRIVGDPTWKGYSGDVTLNREHQFLGQWAGNSPVVCEPSRV